MKHWKGMMVALLFARAAEAQVLSRMEWPDKTLKTEFRSVYETNLYFNDRDEAIELKYADLKVPIFEVMEGPQDSLWMIDEKIAEFRALVKEEEARFIQWEKSADRAQPTYLHSRESRQKETCERIAALRFQMENLEQEKAIHIRIIRAQEEKLLKLDRSMEKELEQNKAERQAALSKMFRA